MGKLIIDGEVQGDVAFQIPESPERQEQFLGWVAVQLVKAGYDITINTKIAIVEGNILVAHEPPGKLLSD